MKITLKDFVESARKQGQLYRTSALEWFKALERGYYMSNVYQVVGEKKELIAKFYNFPFTLEVSEYHDRYYTFIEDFNTNIMNVWGLQEIFPSMRLAKSEKWFLVGRYEVFYNKETQVWEVYKVSNKWGWVPTAIPTTIKI